MKQANEDTFDRMQLESLQAVDEAVAAIIQALQDIGQDQTTMIVYASDNGYSWGSHRWEPKQCPYEECMRVPLAIRYPPLAPLPRVETGFGLNIDHAETLAELAGATPDPGVEGASLVRPARRNRAELAYGLPRGALERADHHVRPGARCADGSTPST